MGNIVCEFLNYGLELVSAYFGDELGNGFTLIDQPN